MCQVLHNQGNTHIIWPNFSRYLQFWKITHPFSNFFLFSNLDFLFAQAQEFVFYWVALSPKVLDNLSEKCLRSPQVCRLTPWSQAAGLPQNFEHGPDHGNATAAIKLYLLRLLMLQATGNSSHTQQRGFIGFRNRKSISREGFRADEPESSSYFFCLPLSSGARFMLCLTLLPAHAPWHHGHASQPVTIIPHASSLFLKRRDSVWPSIPKDSAKIWPDGLASVTYLLQNECACPLRTRMWKPNSHCNGTWRWCLWGWWGHEGGALVNGIGALKEDTLESSPQLLPCWRHSKKIIIEPQSRLSPDIKHAVVLISDFPPSGIVRS